MVLGRIIQARRVGTARIVVCLGMGCVMHSEGILETRPDLTMAGLLRPVATWRARLCAGALVLVGSFLIGLAAQWAIPLPWVPVTGQTFAVLLVGALLGARLGPAAVVAYLVEGAAGLPVFGQGKGGLAVLLGPTGGYLVGFVAAAHVVGLLAQRGWDRRFHTTMAAMILGNAVIYVFGLAWLSVVSGMDAQGLLRLGLYPFIPGDLAKACLAAVLLPSAWGIASRFRRHDLHESGGGLP